VCGLLFSQARETVLLVSLGVCLVLAGNIISYSYHAYQAELFPTSIRARATSFPTVITRIRPNSFPPAFAHALSVSSIRGAGFRRCSPHS